MLRYTVIERNSNFPKTLKVMHVRFVIFYTDGYAHTTILQRYVFISEITTKICVLRCTTLFLLPTKSRP